MESIVTSIKLDIDSPVSSAVIKAQQHDNGSRYIEISLNNQGKKYNIPDGITVQFEGSSSNGVSFAKECSYKNNIITVELDSNILYYAGVSKARIVLYDQKKDVILSTPTMTLSILKDPCNKDKIVADNMNILDRLILDVAALKEEMSNMLKNFGLATVGFSEDATFVCEKNATNNQVQFQEAVDYLTEQGGGVVKVLPGEYTFDCVVYLHSNIHIEAENDVKIKLANQYIAELPTATTANSSTIVVGKDIFERLYVGSEIGLTDGSTGYIVNEEKAYHGFIDSMNEDDYSITLKDAPRYSYTHICTLNSIFRADDKFQGSLDNISIVGGEYDGNKGNTQVWIADMCQNGLIFGGVSNLLIKDVYVHDFRFQGIHNTGELYSELYNHNSSSRLDKCIVANCDASGICVDSNDSVLVNDCQGLNNGGNGLQLVVVDKAVVIGGKYSGNGFCGIRSCHDEIKCSDVRIMGAEVLNNGRGIGIKNMTNTTVTGCVTSNNAEAGIYLEENCDHVIISSCSCKDENVGVKELSEGTVGNIVSSMSYNNCIVDCQTSSATIIDGTDYKALTKDEFEEFKQQSIFGDTHVIESSDNQISMTTETDVLGYHLAHIATLPVTFKVVTKNLFDYSIYTSNIATYMGYNGMKLSGLKPNTTYTCSTQATSGNTLYFGQNLDKGVDENGGVLSAQSDANGCIYIWILSGRANYDGMVNGDIWIQVEEGSKATGYVPYDSIETVVNEYDGKINSLIGEVIISTYPSTSFSIFSQSLSGKIDEHINNIDNPHNVTKSQVGLGNVDNTSDSDKPVSTATQTELHKKANLVSPIFTGTPKAPTAASGTNTTQIATTAFVQNEIANLVDSAPETMNTLNELATVIEEHQEITEALDAAITNKVDKVEGKGLSTNDLTDELLEKVNNAPIEKELTLSEYEVLSEEEKNNSTNYFVTDEAKLYKNGILYGGGSGNGGNAETVNGHTVESDVPANAVFTDTVYDDVELRTSVENKLDKNGNIEELVYFTITNDLKEDPTKEEINNQLNESNKYRGENLIGALNVGAIGSLSCVKEYNDKIYVGGQDGFGYYDKDFTTYTGILDRETGNSVALLNQWVIDIIPNEGDYYIVTENSTKPFLILEDGTVGNEWISDNTGNTSRLYCAVSNGAGSYFFVSKINNMVYRYTDWSYDVELDIANDILVDVNGGIIKKLEKNYCNFILYPRDILICTGRYEWKSFNYLFDTTITDLIEGEQIVNGFINGDYLYITTNYSLWRKKFNFTNHMWENEKEPEFEKVCDVNINLDLQTMLFGRKDSFLYAIEQDNLYYCDFYGNFMFNKSGKISTYSSFEGVEFRPHLFYIFTKNNNKTDYRICTVSSLGLYVHKFEYILEDKYVFDAIEDYNERIEMLEIKVTDLMYTIEDFEERLTNVGLYLQS